MSFCVTHFDYLQKYGAQLQDALEYDSLHDSISRWRTNGMADPDAVVVGCRKIVEISLKALIGDSECEGMNLAGIIDYAEDEGIINHTTALKCHEIRNKGNAGAHASVKAVDAKMCLELLDDFLRWFVSENYCSDMPSLANIEYEDTIFLVKDALASESLRRRARTAAILSDDSSIEREANDAVKQGLKRNDEIEQAMDEMALLIERASSLTSKFAQSNSDFADQQNALLGTCDQMLEQAKTSSSNAAGLIEQVSAKVDEILGEYDYIKSLLTNGGTATLEQLDVLAFPRTSTNVKTNVLKLKGEAGSGKTLCLLAKLLRQVNASQAQAFEELAPKALFVCFNKPLAHHINSLLDQCSADYPFAKERITVESFDNFINQLVKPARNAQAHYRSWSTDVRYPDRWQLCYEKTYAPSECTHLVEAMSSVAEKYPDRKGEYFLNTESTDDRAWVADEIRWLECRYDGPGAASDYVNGAARTGRGTTHLPDASRRTIIVEIWSEYCNALARDRKYTIEQALHKLDQSDALPQYDAVAIDESQDLSLLAVRVLFKMRKDSPDSYMYIAGDEEQKIYQRDFTWRELDSSAVGYTITLNENKRNSRDIAAFANRLLGIKTERSANEAGVFVGKWTNAQVEGIIQKCMAAGESVAVIGGTKWPRRLGCYDESQVVGISELRPKGLEFDNVIVDYDRTFASTLDEEQRLRYVHFSRARKRLYVRLSDNVPELMTAYYSDYLQ